jgi:hypothetical protein
VLDVLLNNYGVSEKYRGEESWPLRPYEAVVLLVTPTEVVN